MMNRIIPLMLMLAVLAGCGVKPDEIEPPDEVKNKEFPRTYPNVTTDPPPYVVPTR